MAVSRVRCRELAPVSAGTEPHRPGYGNCQSLKVGHLPRKLKTYVTNLGFFELAIAAPSMKAALQAWGMTHDAFQHGFAKQTDDPEIVAQTNAKPGVVLRRGVGTTGPFTEDAKLPDTLPAIRPLPSPKSKPPAKARPVRHEKRAKAKGDNTAIISFEKARREREKRQAKEEEERANQRAKRVAATEKAEDAFAQAREAHEQILAEIEREREKLDRRLDKEERRWDGEKERLENAIDKARNQT